VTALTAARQHVDRAAQWPAIALGFSIPVSVALDNLLVALLLLLWLAGGRYREKLSAIRGNPVALLACAVFALYVVGATYSAGGHSDVLHTLDKASIFLLLPIMITLFPEAKTRDRALQAFIAALTITLVLSFLVWCGFMPESSLIKGEPANAVVFKKHITHSLFMAFAAFLFAVLAHSAVSRIMKMLFGVMAALAAFNVFFMVHGRTGQLVLFALLFYYLFWCFRWRGLLIAAATGACIVSAAYLMPSSSLHQRAALALQEAGNWQPGVASSSSVGQRLEFYRNSLKIVREHPFLGVGTGGFPAAYARQVEGTAMGATRNPHNEYLMVAVQLGLPGLVLLLALFWAQWRLAARLPDRTSQAAARGLVITYAVASMVSSTLIDHAEGLFFVWMSAVLFAGLAQSTRNHAGPAAA
jgi:O-antigen ligase